MLPCFTAKRSARAIPISVVAQVDYVAWVKKQSSFVKIWLESSRCQGEAGTVRLLPDTTGCVERVLCCISDMKNSWGVGQLPLTLPEGIYYFDLTPAESVRFATVWGLGAYQFSRYKKPLRYPAQLLLLENKRDVLNCVEAIYLVRDLINTPTEDMGPSELGAAAAALAKQFDATVQQIVGDALVKKNFPMIYAVGRAADDAPRLIDLRWGHKKHPKVTLVGKGVCFDSGGLDIKPSSAMLLMKKDMGGAAHVLGLARMIMDAKLPVCLRVLIPAVENSISGNAYRPGDILQSRQGLTVEIGNTDAEGRLVLADALTEAVSEKPDLLIDIATLTGAARVALGTELPALFCNDDAVAHDVLTMSTLQNDMIWRLPLFSAYRESLNSTIADINNAGVDSYGGAITAALFLKEFVPDDIAWMHFDLMAWNLRAKPGRPQGGEAMGLRALFEYLKERFN